MFEFFQGENGQHYFNVKGENGEIIATSEGYTRPEDARRGAMGLVRRVFEFTANTEPPKVDPGDIEHPHVEPGETQA